MKKPQRKFKVLEPVDLLDNLTDNECVLCLPKDEDPRDLRIVCNPHRTLLWAFDPVIPRQQWDISEILWSDKKALNTTERKRIFRDTLAQMTKREALIRIPKLGWVRSQLGAELLLANGAPAPPDPPDAENRKTIKKGTQVVATTANGEHVCFRLPCDIGGPSSLMRVRLVFDITRMEAFIVHADGLTVTDCDGTNVVHRHIKATHG
jgi:hypothetical protein